MSTAATQLRALKARNDLAAERLRGRELRLRSVAMSKAKRAARAMASRPPAKSARYDSATRTRLRPGPGAGGGPADAHLRPWVHGAMRRDCQDAERNSTVARICIHRFKDLAVGDGPIVNSTSQDRAWNREADTLWNLFFDALDPDYTGHIDLRQERSGTEIFRGTAGSWCTDGDQLIIRTRFGSLQVVEGERIVNPGGGGMPQRLPNGNTVSAGVETDRYGRTVAYHVAEWGPYGQLSTTRPQRVEARWATLVRCPIGDKPNMLRGEPALQAVLHRIERLDAYEEKVAIAAEIATLFCGIVKTKDPAGLQSAWEMGTENQPTRENANQPRVVEMEPGMLHFMGDTDTVTGMKPEFPTTNFRDYVLYHLMLIGAELGLPLVATAFDATQLSWSNIKALLSLCYRSLEPCHEVLGRVVRQIRAWKIRQWMDEGLLRTIDDYSRCSVQFPRAPVVDFASEVKGYVEAINNRLMTRDQAIQALGTGTFAAICLAAALEEQALATAGIPAINAPGAGSAGSAKPTAPEG